MQHIFPNPTNPNLINLIIFLLGAASFIGGFLIWSVRYNFLDRQQKYYLSTFFLCWLGASASTFALIFWLNPAARATIIPTTNMVIIAKVLFALIIAVAGLLISTLLQILVRAINFVIANWKYNIGSNLSPTKLLQSYSIQTGRAIKKIQLLSWAASAIVNVTILYLLL